MEVITKLELLIAEELSKDLTRLWSINELAMALKKQYRPIYAAVQRLINSNILEKSPNGLIKPTFNDTTYLEYAEKKRASEISNKDILIIQKKLARIKSSFFSAILFGSSVKKNGNDIDILIIIPDSENQEEFRTKTEKELGSFYSQIDLSVINEESCHEMLNRQNQLNVMNEIMKNHIILIGGESFYRIVNRWKYD
jgi:predicted nucleotidyltransferase